MLVLFGVTKCSNANREIGYRGDVVKHYAELESPTEDPSRKEEDICIVNATKCSKAYYLEMTNYCIAYFNPRKLFI